MQDIAEKIISNIFDYREQIVGKVMTPLDSISAISMLSNLDDLAHKLIDSGHSKIPVYEDDLNNIHEIGEIMASSIVEYFSNQSNMSDINECISLGVTFKKNKVSSEFKDLSFVITGSFENLSRSDIKKKLEGFGARVSSSISKNTSYLVLGSNPGSKLQKANNLNISIINETDLDTLLEGVLPS